LVDTAKQANAIQESRDLGFMLYDLDYGNAADPKPRFFRAQLVNGAINVPAWNSQEVRG
jgi:CRISPR-associated protein Cas5d